MIGIKDTAAFMKNSLQNEPQGIFHRNTGGREEKEENFTVFFFLQDIDA